LLCLIRRLFLAEDLPGGSAGGGGAGGGGGGGGGGGVPCCPVRSSGSSGAADGRAGECYQVKALYQVSATLC